MRVATLQIDMARLLIQMSLQYFVVLCGEEVQCLPSIIFVLQIVKIFISSCHIETNRIILITLGEATSLRIYEHAHLNRFPKYMK